MASWFDFKTGTIRHPCKSFGMVSNYLLNRCQSVCVDGTYSSKQYITAGVPQGSVYINDISEDLPDYLPMIPPLLFFLSVNLFEIERVLNEDLSKLSAWAKRWLIKFNAQKKQNRNNANFKYIQRS